MTLIFRDDHCFFLKKSSESAGIFLRFPDKPINSIMVYQGDTAEIIGCFYRVYNTLGFGFLEKVYEKALLIELQRSGIPCARQVPIKVYYQGQQVGDYYADIIVNENVIIELKAVETLAEEHEFQLINYLKATNLEIGLLLNFGKKPQIRRKIFTNDRKALPNP